MRSKKLRNAAKKTHDTSAQLYAEVRKIKRILKSGNRDTAAVLSTYSRLRGVVERFAPRSSKQLVVRVSACIADARHYGATIELHVAALTGRAAGLQRATVRSHLLAIDIALGHQHRQLRYLRRDLPKLLRTLEP
jgi:hypothetical protein